jgi:hypothetical protein
MAHFNQHSSGAPVECAAFPPEAEQNCLPANKPRFSIPNYTGERRLKRHRRNQSLREKRRKESGNAKQRRLTN